MSDAVMVYMIKTIFYKLESSKLKLSLFFVKIKFIVTSHNKRLTRSETDMTARCTNTNFTSCTVTDTTTWYSNTHFTLLLILLRETELQDGAKLTLLILLRGTELQDVATLTLLISIERDMSVWCSNTHYYFTNSIEKAWLQDVVILTSLILLRGTWVAV